MALFKNYTSKNNREINFEPFSDNIRALPAGELAKTVSEYNPNVQAMDTIKDAVEEAFSLAGEQDVIIAFGSLSFIGEMTDIVENL